MKKIIISLGISFACLALAACAASSTSSGTEITGTIWILTELNGNPPVAGSSITAMFTQDGKISGTAGCNQYLGSYRISGNTISISGTLATTLMMCEISLMTQETAYLEALQEAKSYSTMGDQLSLINPDNAVSAVFKAQKQDLAGTSWEVITYNNGKQAVTSVMAGTSLTADFGADGTLSGKSGCNSYSGSYKVEGSKISIGPIASTKMYCNEPAGVMEQETQYLLALESAATYRIEGNSLELRTQDGALAVQLASK
jgi:heat shock protein HslJ